MVVAPTWFPIAVYDPCKNKNWLIVLNLWLDAFCWLGVCRFAVDISATSHSLDNWFHFWITHWAPYDRFLFWFHFCPHSSCFPSSIPRFKSTVRRFMFLFLPFLTHPLYPLPTVLTSTACVAMVTDAAKDEEVRSNAYVNWWWLKHACKPLVSHPTSAPSLHGHQH